MVAGAGLAFFGRDARAFTHVVQKGDTLASVAEKRGDYFMRWHVTFAPGALEDWLMRVFNPILQQVADWWDSIKADPFNPHGLGFNPLHYTNPEHLYTRYGRSQYFEKLTRGSDYGLRRRT